MTRHVHVVGAGLAGLAAALRLSAEPGLAITLWEATGRAGGRCWSFHDRTLDRVIDNGNHLMLSGNHAVLDYVRRIGSEHHLRIEDAALPFVDLATGADWTVRVPGGLGDVLRGRVGLPGSLVTLSRDLSRLLRAGPGATVAEAIGGRGTLWHGFWEPMCLAVLNEPAERGSARLLAAVIRRTVMRGAKASRPVLAQGGLGPALVDPAVAALKARGVRIVWRAALEGVKRDRDVLRRLRFSNGETAVLGQGDVVVAAGASAGARATGSTPPAPGQTILNAHFRVGEAEAERFPPLLGLVSGAAHWIFRRGDVLSVTVSAAEAVGLSALSRDAALDRLFEDVELSAGGGRIACHARRLVRAPAATWDQSPAGVAARPSMRTGIANLVLAGDHVAGPLPSSIEAAIRSGDTAAREVLQPGGSFASRAERSGARSGRARPALH
ncbi:flavin-dependent amine oxidoreductase [Palleronia aestuarii]|uniref:Flavin-dependent amine oxidoreductase n=1 Tax=Palleronia aestuarii TaxID=568105 RepID=A0A2W7NUL8_9RHOB|nr:flavin-dependent amine oxidoreductase [Palleronia aestuarii]